MNSDDKPLLARLGDGSLDERIVAAHELEAIGDPRAFGERVSIPTGELHHKVSPDSAVELIDVAGFAIDRYPVTVAAYAEFIDEGGYDSAAWWSTEGWRWRVDDDVSTPRFWDDPEWDAYLIGNHPVVGVSGHEAEAYADFRDARLPTEHEWERACRGDDARNYPWGNEWRDDACGHRAFGPRGTLPIGLFPESASPFGLCDLCGAVWQWTSNAHGDARVVCGGAWNNLPWSIGAHGRNAYARTARFSNLGFRLAW